jgi:hypothetical protein
MTTRLLDHRNDHPGPERTRFAWRSRPWRLLGAIVVGIDLLLVPVALDGLGIRLDPGVALGAGTSENPIPCLGSTVDRTGCETVPLAIGEGYRVICVNWSAVTSLDYVARVVSVYAGTDVFSEFAGPMPQGLSWHEGIDETVAALGDPKLITDAYGTPTFVYMYDNEPYGSLELRFNAADELVQINACLTH